MASSLDVPQPQHPINPILIKERSKATFSPEKVTHLFDNSDPAQTSRRRRLEKLVESDPTGIFSNDSNIYLHRTDRHVRSLAKTVRLIEICRSIGIGDAHNGQIVLDKKDWSTLTSAMGLGDGHSPLSLHWHMFIPNIIALADDEQQSKWLPLCRDWKMIGCYAQTEVGHGSNVRGMETTATFVRDGNDGYWIINSPTLTSWKFWPGALGRSSNHAMVIARLIDGDGIDRGVHNFLVQTRKYSDHTFMPGVVCGDIGPKIGYNIADNGFAKFDNVKIPRRNMAMRFAHVDQNGRYTKKSISDATAKISYITMMQVRAWLVSEASDGLRRGTTIAIRYSAIRKQGFKNDASNEENQIIDYKQQQYRLFPLLAASYCFFFSGQKTMNDLKAVEESLMKLAKDEQDGKTGSGIATTITKTEVGDMHATTCCLKAFSTTLSCDGLEDCRKSCGGHGFLACSGLPELISLCLVHPTVEGDNAMLPTQVVKVLLKLVKDMQTDVDKATKSWANCEAMYLVQPLKLISRGKTERCSAKSRNEMLSIQLCLKAFQHRAARLLADVAQQIQTAIMNGKSFEEAWNGSLIQMGRVSKAHALYILLKNFTHGIEEGSKTVLGSNEVNVLQDLALLFGLHWIEKDDGEFIVDGYLSAQQVKWVRSCVSQMLDKIRPNAIALVDANDLSDFQLQSALGRFDGNVYEAILKTSKKDPLNETEPGPGYKEHLKRLIVDGIGAYSGSMARL